MGTNTSPTAVDVFEHIESGLHTEDTVELSDKELDATGVTRLNEEPIAQAERDNLPISWKLYNLSDIESHDRTGYLAIERHSMQKGDRRSIPYAIGLGRLDYDPASVPSLDTMRETTQNKLSENEHIEDAAFFEQLHTGIEVLHDDVFDIALKGNAWGFSFDGTKMYISLERRWWRGDIALFDEFDLSNEQREAVKSAGNELIRPHPTHLDTNMTFEYALEVGFETQ